MSKRPGKAEPIPAGDRWLAPRVWGMRVLALTHVVTPLLFFTNLTRNPYYTQIVLLNLAILLAAALWGIECWRSGEWRLPRVTFEWPLAVFLAVAFASTIVSWFSHPELRPGIAFEGSRVWMFTIINSAMAFYLPLLFTRPSSEPAPTLSIWTDIVLAAGWGFLWYHFHALKNPTPSTGLWDTYGGFLWVLAVLYALLRVRRGHTIEFFHVIFAVTLLAGGYGLLQYSGKDIIWTGVIQPYGGRPVSTFGNPNFLSSYLMLVSPVAFALGLQSRRWQAAGYYAIAAMAVLSVLGTLTRSTYVGLLAAYAAMGLLLYRRENRKASVKLLVWAGVFVLLVLVFPTTPVTKVQSPVARFTEIFRAFETGQSYGPWHQRILIWSSAWDMVREKWLLGKGWGCFELFYPFYQGKFLLSPVFAQWRTHANNAHNVLMEIWAQTGIIGTGAALWLLAAMLAGGLWIFRRNAERTSRVLTAALVACLVGMVTDNFFGNVSVFFAVPAFLFWWFMGTLYNESPAPAVMIRPIGKGGRVLLVGLFVFCVASAVYFFSRWKQEIYYFQGFRLSKAGQVVESYKKLEKAYAWFPGEVNSNYEMGNSYARHAKQLADQNRLEESRKFNQKAVEAYQAAVRANPGYDEIYFNLAVTHLQSNDTDAAMKNLRIALLINPLLKEAYGTLANVCLTRDKPEEAIPYLEQAVAAFPNDKDLWNNLGYFYSKLDRDEKSYDAYKRSVQLDPTFDQAQHNLAVVCSKLGRNEPLLQLPAILKQMNEAYARKDFQRALAAAERAVALLPENVDVRISLGNIYFYLGDVDHSVEAFQKAIAISPNSAVAHVNLGQVYQAAQKMDLARLSYERALALNPSDAATRRRLESLPQTQQQ